MWCLWPATVGAAAVLGPPAPHWPPWPGPAPDREASSGPWWRDDLERATELIRSLGGDLESVWVCRLGASLIVLLFM